MIDVGLVETSHFFGIYGLEFGHIGMNTFICSIYLYFIGYFCIYNGSDRCLTIKCHMFQMIEL